MSGAAPKSTSPRVSVVTAEIDETTAVVVACPEVPQISHIETAEGIVATKFNFKDNLPSAWPTTRHAFRSDGCANGRLTTTIATMNPNEKATREKSHVFFRGKKTRRERTFLHFGVCFFDYF